MIPQPPPGQGPVDPRGAASPPSPTAYSQGGYPIPPAPQAMGTMPPGQFGGYPPSGMPQPPMYPMMMPPPGFGPPPRRSGVGKTLLLVLMFLVLCGSVLINLVLLAGGSMGGGSTVRETVIEGSGSDKVAVVPIAGIIDGNMSRQVAGFLDQAEKDANVKAVVLEIDSPGGTVTASDEIYARLLRFKQDKNVPVIVSMGSLATSGGYYAACAGDRLFAQQTTLTGNIGVLMPRFNFSKLMDKYGVEENTIVSKGARYKNAGSTFSPEDPKETEYLQGIADSMFTRFKAVVQQGRAAQMQTAGSSIEQVADGRALTADEALANGLIDEIGYLGDAIAHATKTANLSNPHVFRYSKPPTLFDLFGMNFSGPLSRGGTTVNGININIDRKLLEELAAPRVLYLWRGE